MIHLTIKKLVNILFSIFQVLQIQAESREGAGINLSSVLCGRKLVREPKVVGGEDAYPGEFPWIVSIKEKFGTDNELAHICGGFIISKTYIISAAHCFEKYTHNGKIIRTERLRVTVGEHNLSALEVPVNSMDIPIEKLTIHPQFNIYGYVNDIAVIKLKREIEWTPYALPACLSSANFEPTPGENGTVAGWGSLVDIKGDNGPVYPHSLKKASIPILSNAECSKWFHRKAVNWKPKEAHFCAGFPEGGVDACRGDSGSPFSVQEGNKFIVVGIVAAGKGCARSYLPGVYTRVNKYIDWIERQITTS